MARIKPGSMSHVGPRWTQRGSLNVGRAPRRRERRGVSPQDILAWLQVSEAVMKDEGLIGSVASRIQKEMRESSLAEKRAQHKADMQAAEDKRRADMAAEVDRRRFENEQAMQFAAERAKGFDPRTQGSDSPTPQLALDMEEVGFAVPPDIRYQKAAPDLLERESQPIDILEEAVVSEQVPAAPSPGATRTPAPGWEDQSVKIGGGTVPIKGYEGVPGVDRLREEAGTAATRPGYGRDEFVGTLAELNSLAYGARTPEEYNAVTSRLPEVMKMDPSLGGTNLASIIGGPKPDMVTEARRTLLGSFLEGQKQRRSQDELKRMKTLQDIYMKDEDFEVRYAQKVAQILNLKDQATGRALSRAANRLKGNVDKADLERLRQLAAHASWIQEGRPDGVTGRFPAEWVNLAPTEARATVFEGLSGKTDKKAFRQLLASTDQALDVEHKIDATAKFGLRGAERAMTNAMKSFSEFMLEAGSIDNIVDSDSLLDAAKQQLNTAVAAIMEYNKILETQNVPEEQRFNALKVYKGLAPQISKLAKETGDPKIKEADGILDAIFGSGE